MPKYDYSVERVDNWTQMQTKLDQYGRAGYRIAVPPIKVGTTSYQLILEREID